MICLHCKKEFKPKRSDTKYCSPKCRKLAFLITGTDNNGTDKSIKTGTDKRTDNNDTPGNDTLTDNDRIGKAIQGYCHGCGKDFTKIKGLTTDGSYLTQVDNNCICIHCLSKGVTHHSLGLEVNACS